MSKGDRVFRIVTRFLVGALVVGLLAVGVLIWATRMGYLPPSPPAPEPELTPQERFASEFQEGTISVSVRFWGSSASQHRCSSLEPCIELVWLVKKSEDYPTILYRTYTTDPDFINVLELFIRGSEMSHPDLKFKITLLQEDHYFDDGIIYVEGTLIRIVRQTEDGYLIWEPFTFQPSLELIEEVLGGTTIDDPQLADWQRLELKTMKEAYSAMVEYAQQGRFGRAFNLRVEITQAVLDRALEDASVIPLCHGPYRCDYKILERNADNSLKLYLVEDREIAEEAVRTLRYNYQKVADLVTEVEILSLTDYDEELDVNWTSYNLAIQISWDGGKHAVWFSIQPGKNIEVIHWIF